MKRDRRKAPSAGHGPSGLRFLPLEKTTKRLLSGNSVHTTWPM